jgi:hypothetical protein
MRPGRLGRELRSIDVTSLQSVRLFVPAAVIAAVSLSGCSSDGSDGAASSPPPSSSVTTTSSAPMPTQTATVTVTATPEPATGSATATASPDPGRCTSDELEVTVRPSPGGGAAGSTTSEIVLTNTGDRSCETGGFGGVSYVGGGNGTQIGAAATRTGATPKQLTLKPGASAVQELRETEAGNYPAGKCDPTPVDGLRIYPPDETSSLFAEHATTGCQSDSVKLLEVGPYELAS